ncbi:MULTISPECIES: hypothetical protein [unclassified Myroides]|uniref:hypothetical protein n=1 Tax=unclassified Myroides TaxID=2642485 RepID=UPI0015FE7A96|nr:MULTISPECIES: hypothetical protein [unclassified Myroides]MBB1149871.1 hypothetical protein [Myroides sp. NP-2]MDM1408510.1 hypothetical protein [Myroides sp. DF42-4-2]
MNGKTQLIVLVLCVLVTLGITFFDFTSSQDELAQKVKGYQETTAIVKKVHALTVTRYGSKQPTYDLRVRLSDSTEVNMYRRKLDAKLTEGSTVNILYNPASPQDDIYVRE